MTRVNVKYSTYQSREPDPQDSWDWGEYNGSIEGAFIAANDYEFGYNGYDTDLEPPFVAVLAGYSTGNTFGSYYEACVVGVTKTVEEALSLVDEAKAFKGFGELSNGFYVPWTGYFEYLLSIDIERIESED